MGRCKHIYRVGFTRSVGPHAELRCVLQSHSEDKLCLIDEPMTGMQFKVSPKGPANVTLENKVGAKPGDTLPTPWPVDPPKTGPFGPQINLQPQFDTWAEADAEVRLRKLRTHGKADETSEDSAVRV